MESRSHTEVVRASLDVCFSTLIDFPKYPDWFGLIRSATIVSSDDETQQWTVRYELDAILKTIEYTLAYQGERPTRLTWKMTQGELRAIEGHYDLIELEPGLTEATCEQSIDVGLWVPGMVRRVFEQTAVQDSVREFKKAAEARAEAS